MIQPIALSARLAAMRQRAARIARAVATPPTVMPALAGWATRFVRRAGGGRAPWRPTQPTTFVLHRFMDAAATAAAWDHLEHGTPADEPAVVEAVERLPACAYSMPHPQTAQLFELLPHRPTSNGNRPPTHRVSPQ